MTIKQLNNNEIDKVKWDEIIADSPNGIAYAYSWYLDAVFPTWEALIIDDYAYVFPLTLKTKYSIRYFFTPIFAMQLGVFSKNEITSEIQALCYEYLGKINMFDISVNPSNNLIPKGFDVIEKECQIVHLNQSYDTIAKGYSNNLKRNLNKAIKTNLVVKKTENIANVIFLFKQNRGNKIQEIKEDHYQVLSELIQNGLDHKQIQIIECYDDREVIASGFFSFCNKKIIYHKGGTNGKGKKYGAMHLIIDSIIREYEHTDWTLDFGGSSIDSVKRFNKNFSDDYYTYNVLQKSPFLLNSIRKLKNWAIKE